MICSKNNFASGSNNMAPVFDENRDRVKTLQDKYLMIVDYQQHFYASFVPSQNTVLEIYLTSYRCRWVGISFLWAMIRSPKNNWIHLVFFGMIKKTSIIQLP